MPVPDFQTLMLPALRTLEQSSPRTTGEVRHALAAKFNLTRRDERGQEVDVSRRAHYSVYAESVPADEHKIDFLLIEARNEVEKVR